MSIDYRLSHLQKGKGRSYHATFSNCPYRKMVWQFEQGILDRILRDYCTIRPLNHLDFACGTGRIISYLAGRTSIQVGVDISPSMLDVAQQNNRTTEIIEADLTKEDVLGERKFTLITAFRFFSNAQPELRRDVMHLLSKHLEDAGYLVFNNHKNAGSARHRLYRLLNREYQGMCMDEVTELLSEVGLEVAGMYHLCVLPVSEAHPVFPMILLRPIESWLSRWRPLRNLGQNLIFVCRRSVKVSSSE